MSKREQVLDALHGGLQSLDARVLRGEPVPERIPAAGLLILHDGDPGEPEVTMSPLTYHYRHRAQIGVVVQSSGDRVGLFDALLTSLGVVLASDRTLGGLCDWVEPSAPEPDDLPVEGAASLKAAMVPVVLHYSTSDPLA